MTTLTFYGGVAEIGGNKILLRDGETELFLDFGKNFAQEKAYYDDPYLSPREDKHLLALGILPKLEGLYKSDTASRDNMAGVLISHPHTDHMDYIRYLKDDIPIYCGDDTRNIITAREFSSQSKSTEYMIANLTKEKGEQVIKEFKTFRAGDRVKIGSLTVEAAAVDHSVPGAYGFIINTSAGPIVYTGDFRLHGTRSEATKDFINKAKYSKPRVLIIEGTNIVQGRIFSEKEVEEKAGAIIKSTPGLVVASFSTVDVDRIKTFYKVAKENGRKLAISMKQAFLLDALQSDPDVDIFSPGDSNILIFSRQKKTYRQWETQIKDSYKNVVESTDLCKMHEEVVLVFSFYDMNEMAEIDPCPGSVFILSQSEPFNEEMELDFNKLLNWLEYYGIPLYTAHASGHAAPHELKQAIAEIAPEKVFLVHTERPKLYQQYIRDLNIDTICPELGREYIL